MAQILAMVDPHSTEIVTSETCSPENLSFQEKTLSDVPRDSHSGAKQRNESKISRARSVDVEEVVSGNNEEDAVSYLTGWRLNTLLVGLCICLFLSNLETTIVSTSLVSISNSLHSFSSSSWIVTAYLITYTGFLVIIAKLSDIFGRKTFTILVIVIFISFSLGCGLTYDMTNLIIFRAFQGIGGGGLYSMAFVVLPEMVPTSKYPLYAAILSSTMALSNLLGPLLGGAVNHNQQSNTAWRWIFLLNAPGGVLALALVILGMPNKFPRHATSSALKKRSKYTMNNFRRVDVAGLLLLLGATVLLITALEEGGTRYSWRSSVTLSLLVISFALWFSFATWQWYQSIRETAQEPIFPWRMATDRFVMGLILNSLFTGACMTSVIINLPQRFQVVNGDSPIAAGYRFLALTFVGSVGSFLSGTLVQRLKIAPFWVLLGGGVLQIIGLGLVGSLSASTKVQKITYLYQVILGLGFGGSLGCNIMTIPLVVIKKDTAVGMGSIGQFRYLGGAIGIAICTNILNKHVIRSLSSLVSPAQLATLLQSTQAVSGLSPAIQDATRQSYAEGYNKQMQAMVGFGVASFLAVLLMYEKNLRKY